MKPEMIITTMMMIKEMTPPTMLAVIKETTTPTTTAVNRETTAPTMTIPQVARARPIAA
jgi:hypothetical protein